MLGMLHAKSLLLNQRYAEADDALATLNVLPYEGATEGRALYREAQLMLGAADARAGKWAEAAKRVAAAREWPEHLGAGKPYPENVDERLEDWLQAQCLDRLGRAAESRAILDRLGPFKPAAPGTLESRVLAAWPPIQGSGRITDRPPDDDRSVSQGHDSKRLQCCRRRTRRSIIRPDPFTSGLQNLNSSRSNWETTCVESLEPHRFSSGCSRSSCGRASRLSSPRRHTPRRPARPTATSMRSPRTS